MNTHHPSCGEYVFERTEMVDLQIRGRGITTPAVIQAMRVIPRHYFVPADLIGEAYNDYPLPIGFGQTISQPYIVALMTDLLHLSGGEKVLEVGSGSGYQATILAELAQSVVSVEIEEHLALAARERLATLGIINVEIIHGDGSGGDEQNAPYDRILVTAAAPHLPEKLLEQLAPGGRMVIPVGERRTQILQIWKKDAMGRLSTENHIGVVFVPLRGKYGWDST